LPFDFAQGFGGYMTGHRETLLAVAGALLLASTVAAGQSPTKFVTPFKGEAAVEMMPAQAKSDGKMVTTKFKVKNMSPGPLTGFKVDEYWYDKKGQAVSGSQTFRVSKPFMPGDIVEVTLQSPVKEGMATNVYMFAHQNGKVKPKKVTKFSETKPAKDS
jgi:hypothetical protein